MLRPESYSRVIYNRKFLSWDLLKFRFLLSFIIKNSRGWPFRVTVQKSIQYSELEESMGMPIWYVKLGLKMVKYLVLYLLDAPAKRVLKIYSVWRKPTFTSFGWTCWNVFFPVNYQGLYVVWQILGLVRTLSVPRRFGVLLIFVTESAVVRTKRWRVETRVTSDRKTCTVPHTDGYKSVRTVEVGNGCLLTTVRSQG